MLCNPCSIDSDLKIDPDKNGRRLVGEIIEYIRNQQSADSRKSYLLKNLQRLTVDNSAMLRLCDILTNRKFIPEAKMVLEHCDFSDSQALAQSAKLAFLEQNYLKAVDDWKSARDNGCHIGIADQLSYLKACEKTHDFSQLLNIANDIQLSPELSEKQVRQLCTVLLRNNQINTALKTIQRLDLIEELNTYIIFARVNSAAGQYDIALKIIRDAEIQFLNENSELTDEEHKRLSLCKLKVLLNLCDWGEVIFQSRKLISRFPDCYPAYQICLRATKFLDSRAQSLSVLAEAYRIFHTQHPDLVIRYCRELELCGQSQKALTILEDCNRDDNGFATALLKKYLRDGLFEKFMQCAGAEQVPNDEKLIAFTDHLALTVRLGLYERLPDIVSMISELTQYGPQDQHLVLECQNQIWQLLEILTSEVADTYRLIETHQSERLIEQIKGLLPAQIWQGKGVVANRVLWNKLSNSEYFGYNNHGDFIKTSVESYIDLIQKQPCVYLETYEVPIHARKLASYLKDRILNKIPTSLIRLGDGEGNYLDYPKYFEAEQATDQEFIQRIWWGDTKLDNCSGTLRASILSRYQQSIDNADILGIPPIRRLLSVFRNFSNGRGELNNGSRGIIAISEKLQFIDCSQKILTSSHIHTDFELWNCYAEILGSLDSVCLITCHSGMDNYLRQRFGIESVTCYTIPGESRYKTMFNDQRADEHCPTVFEELIATLPAVSKGQVFLVGAGFLGKIYCNVIKQNGGIAIDVGSLMDRWAGYHTRVDNENVMTCQGIVYKDRSPKPLEIPRPNQPVNTCEYRDRLLPIMVRDEKPIPCRFLVTGHPRSGTEYTASLFTQLSQRIGHETLQSHGMASWMHAVNDQNTPLMQNDTVKSHPHCRGDLSVEHLLLVVRDPIEVIPSIMIENRNDKSYRYRRFHIFHQCGVDLDNFQCPIECSVASYLYWLELIVRQNPVAILRIEFIEQDIKSFFQLLGLPFTASDIEKQKLKRNATSARYGIEKMKVGRDDLLSIDQALLEKLRVFCAEYKYKL